ncbi:MAG: arsenate reductase [Sphingobacteriales bacterium]|jgi:arsenate reductase
MKIYHNPRCSKSRQTLAIIEELNHDVEIIEYLKQGPSIDEIRDVVKKLGMKPEQIIRKGEKIFKEDYKGREMSDEDWIKAMAENPILIERPIVIKGDKAVLGRPPENVKELF